VTILALDIGQKRTGVALSHGIIAEGIETISGGLACIDPLKKLIEKEKVDQIVIGLPLNGVGEETRQSGEIREVAKEIEKTLNLPVDFVEESYSSTQAMMDLGSLADRKSGNIDQQSAKIILQQYLNERRNISL
jgi:putative Holliday junction resolvase